MLFKYEFASWKPKTTRNSSILVKRFDSFQQSRIWKCYCQSFQLKVFFYGTSRLKYPSIYLSLLIALSICVEFILWVEVKNWLPIIVDRYCHIKNEIGDDDDTFRKRILNFRLRFKLPCLMIVRAPRDVRLRVKSKPYVVKPFSWCRREKGRPFCLWKWKSQEHDSNHCNSLVTDADRSSYCKIDLFIYFST